MNITVVFKAISLKHKTNISLEVSLVERKLIFFFTQTLVWQNTQVTTYMVTPNDQWRGVIKCLKYSATDVDSSSPDVSPSTLTILRLLEEPDVLHFWRCCTPAVPVDFPEAEVRQHCREAKPLSLLEQSSRPSLCVTADFKGGWGSDHKENKSQYIHELFHCRHQMYFCTTYSVPHNLSHSARRALEERWIQ